MSKIVILGGGESGVGSAILAAIKGHSVFLSDGGILKEPYRRRLIEHKIDFEEGAHTLSKLLTADIFIKSPGIPDKAEPVKKAREAGIPVISEIEFAGRYCTAKKICITGSNGKTTTTSLIYEILRRAGISVDIAGNIGESFAWKIAMSDKQPDWYVLELSSFQLDGMFDFRAEIALLLNITPDHLDRYDYKLQNYVDSKFRITRNQLTSDCFIYNHDDSETMQALDHIEITAKAIPFSAKEPVKGAWFDGNNLRYSAPEPPYSEFKFPVSKLRIKGLHNTANALAAIAAAVQAGVSYDTIAGALENFSAIEHRLETVRTVGGVEYINDSKATNVDSAWYALESMTRPTIWIAGGTDKGNDYSALKDLARKKVKALVCMGVDNSKLTEAFNGIIPIIKDTHSLDEAMQAVSSLAESGDTVLLSPACASFDLFQNYEDRGRQFKKHVARL